MTWLRDILAANELALALLHGLAFFVLSLAIVSLQRRGLRLEITRGLAFLAAFGLCEAAAAWSAAWIAPDGTSDPASQWLRLVLLGAGYALLLASALHTILPMGGSERRDRRWLDAAGALFALWVIAVFVIRRSGAPLEDVCLVSEITARYGLALPGSLVGLWGVRRQLHRTISPERLPTVKPHAQVVEAALALFALCGGLVGPAAPFLPANVLNQEALLQMTGIPISLLRGLCGVALTYGVVRTLRVLLSERSVWLEHVERRQALIRERERIGRELHDGIIQSIYATGLLLEGARQSIPDDPTTAQAQLAHAIGSLNETIEDIRRYVFDLRIDMPDEDLRSGLQKIIEDFQANTLLETAFAVEGESGRGMGAERRQHIFQIAREALANAARHARAREVEVRLRFGEQAMQLSISDDGIGLAQIPTDKGQGLRNIRERARLIDGILDVDTAPNKGFTLSLTVPY